jgi:hypothetical protein
MSTWTAAAGDPLATVRFRTGETTFRDSETSPPARAYFYRLALTRNKTNQFQVPRVYLAVIGV